ncbi:MAG TPA: hypothetical protein PLM06_11085 [Anaerolineae bacterium]|nr:hypothetical protein [Anaerolineae bacterium]
MLTILKIFEEHGKTIRLLLGVLIGLILGFIIAWGIWPVQWKDATPGHLHPVYQGYYINAVAQEYQQTGRLDVAKHKLGLDLDEKANPWLKEPQTLEEGFAQALAQTESREMVIALGRLAQDLQVNFRPDVTAPEATTTPEAETPPSRSFLGNLLRVLGYLIIALAVAALLYLLYSRWVEKRRAAGQPEEAGLAGAYGRPMEEAVVEGEAAPALRTVSATYREGDDFFNPSFSIEDGTEFLGECGVDISYAIGSGDHKKVTALEIWLFDKSDIKTVTTVLASEYAFRDPTLRAELAAKVASGGELRQMLPNDEVVLETTALRVRATVKGVVYAVSDDLPERSYFKEANVELRAYRR